MRFHAEISQEAQEQLARLPKDARQRLIRALDEFEDRDDSQWSNVKALQGPQWKGRYRKRVGPYRVIFRKWPERGIVEISAILRREKDISVEPMFFSSAAYFSRRSAVLVQVVQRGESTQRRVSTSTIPI